MTKTRPWIRLYTEVPTDPKVQKLPAALFKFWVNCLCLAGLNDGFLPNAGDLAFKLNMRLLKVLEDLNALLRAGLIEETERGRFQPHAWKERQYESDVSTERVKRFRKRERNVTPTVTVTAPEQSRYRADTEAEQSRAAEAAKPAAEPNPSTIEEARLLIAAYPDARALTGAPDSVLAAHCLKLAGGSLDELGRGLRALMLTGKKPTLSWAWFRTVLPTYLDRRRA